MYDTKNCFWHSFDLDQRLLSSYALLFTWFHELSHEYPEVFDKDKALDWINSTLTAELKHYYALDDSSKIGLLMISQSNMKYLKYKYFKTLKDG